MGPVPIPILIQSRPAPRCLGQSDEVTALLRCHHPMTPRLRHACTRRATRKFRNHVLGSVQPAGVVARFRNVTHEVAQDGQRVVSAHGRTISRRLRPLHLVVLRRSFSQPQSDTSPFGGIEQHALTRLSGVGLGRARLCTWP